MQCISADAAMSAGFAAWYRRRYPEMVPSPWSAGPGEAILRMCGKFAHVFLVTKVRHSDKPTLSNLARALRAAIARSVRKSATCVAGTAARMWPRSVALEGSAGAATRTADALAPVQSRRLARGLRAGALRAPGSYALGVVHALAADAAHRPGRTADAADRVDGQSYVIPRSRVR